MFSDCSGIGCVMSALHKRWNASDCYTLAWALCLGSCCSVHCAQLPVELTSALLLSIYLLSETSQWSCVCDHHAAAYEVRHNANAAAPVCAGAARASKEDVLLLYADKWQQHIMQSCLSLAQLLQVPDAAPLQAAIQAAWLFTDQVSAWCLVQPKGVQATSCSCIGIAESPKHCIQLKTH